MKNVSELKQILGDFLDWNNARLTCFTQMLVALFAVRTVNLRELATAFSSRALLDSRHKRLKRFFAQFRIAQAVLAQWTFALFFSSTSKVYLTIDRTNWFLGKSKINVLTLGVAHEGMAIPLFWQCLPKAGNATAAEHQEIIERFVKHFGIDPILGVLADREFGSGALFKWCNEQKIPFYIRIKEDSILRVGNQKIAKAEKFFRDVTPKKIKVFPMKIEIFGQKVHLTGSRSERGELMVVATNSCPKQAIAVYLRRWEIEVLFACLKGRGFRFEDTRLTHLDRIETLIALLSVGVAWAHKVGEWKAAKKPIVLNQYRESKRPQYSYFRYGADLIREAILIGFQSLTPIINCLKIPPSAQNLCSAGELV